MVLSPEEGADSASYRESSPSSLKGIRERAFKASSSGGRTEFKVSYRDWKVHGQLGGKARPRKKNGDIYEKKACM